MSHPQPTPQDDDQTPVKPWTIPFDELTEGQVITVEVKGSAKRYRVKSVTHEGNTWTASVVPAELDELENVYWPIAEDPKTEPVFDATVLAETAAAAAERRLIASKIITFSRTDHHSPQGWSHVTGGPYTPTTTDNQVINPTLIESIAQWLGERESTHLWPEIHESDKACYRDAARDLITKVKFGLVASAVSLNPEERKIAADALEAMEFGGQEAGKAFAAGLEEMAPGASSAADMGRKIAERNIAASREAGNGFAAALEATGILHGLPGLADDLIRLVAELAPKPWKLTNVSGAANIVAVQLPEPTAPDFTGLEWRDSAAGWDVFAYGSTQHRGQIQLRTPEFVDLGDARNVAAALLAAAAKIEAGE